VDKTRYRQQSLFTLSIKVELGETSCQWQPEQFGLRAND
jgi:hypothetical protein